MAIKYFKESKNGNNYVTLLTSDCDDFGYATNRGIDAIIVSTKTTPQEIEDIVREGEWENGLYEVLESLPNDCICFDSWEEVYW